MPLLDIASNSTLHLDKKTKLLDSKIYELFNSKFPVRQIRVRGSKKQWLSAELLRLINLKNRFYKRVFQTSDSVTDNQIRHYRKFKNYVLNQIKKLKSNIYLKSCLKVPHLFIKLCADSPENRSLQQ